MIGCLFLSLLVTMPAAAEEEVTQKTALLLMSHHELPEKEVFLRVSPKVKTTLFALARSEKNTLLRNRALQALAYWPTNDVLLLYRELLRSKRTALGTRHRLLLLLGRTFPKKSVPTLVPYLEQNDPQLRLTAISALARSNTHEAIKALERAKKRAEGPVEREALERSAPGK